MLPVGRIVLGYCIQAGAFGDAVEASVLDTAGIGWIYDKIFGPGTYYKFDTVEAFQSLVHAVGKDTVGQVLSEKGIRFPSEPEQKPIMKGFLAQSQHAGR